jgi:hypothetical protein
VVDKVVVAKAVREAVKRVVRAVDGADAAVAVDADEAVVAKVAHRVARVTTKHRVITNRTPAPPASPLHPRSLQLL